METLYERIETMCKNRGLNITEMCTLSGVSRGILTDLKMGRSKGMSAKSLKKIASFFGISVDELLGREVEGIDAELLEYLEMLRSRPECRMLLSTIKNATREEVEANIRVIEAVRGISNGKGSH